jgi:2-polyprenyl-3-methyl-5-hydroxy-6-metoxy-1,4-benzoquinol methylase
MTTEPQCLLCKHQDIQVIASIPTDQLIALYRKRAKVDVTRSFDEPVIRLVTCSCCGLKFYSPQVVGDGLFYDELQQYGGYYITEKDEFKEAAKYITPGDEVLEVGAGEGQFTRYIRCKSYTGLEFSEKAIQKAQSKGIALVKESLGEHASRYPGKYDAVCYFQVLEHVPEPGKFIEESLACLKPGGRLIVAVPSEDSFIRDAANFYLNMPPHHISRWTDDTLRKVAGLNGLAVEQVFHETLLPIHRHFYFKTRIYDNLRKIFRRPARPVENDPFSTLLYGLAAILGRIRMIFPPSDKKITGQAVTVIYKKPPF